MTCESLSSVAGAYLDDELDAGLNVQVREHLAACESCAKVQNQLLALRAAIRDNAPYYRAPADLSHRVRTAVRRAERQSGGAWRWLAVAAAMLLAVSLGWNIALFRSRTSGAMPSPVSAIRIRTSTPVATHLRRRFDRAGRPFESRAVVDGNASVGCAFLGPAHGKAMVQRQTGLLAGCQRLRRAGIPIDRRAGRLRGRASGGGFGLPGAAACHQPVYVARGCIGRRYGACPERLPHRPLEPRRNGLVGRVGS